MNLTLAFALALSTSGPGPQANATDLLARTVESVMAEKRIPGVVVGILRGDELVERRAFGLAEVDGERSMTPEHLFQVGSVTKPFTATLAASLIDEGLLDPDAPIGPWFPDEVELPNAIGSLTVRQLASHSSGLPREPVNRRNLPDSPSVMLPYSTSDLYAGLAVTQLETRPGATWSYSNLGYAVLGHVVELASKRKYGALLADRILRPLGMDRSGVHPTPSQERAMATHYWPEDGEHVARPRWMMGEIAGFCGVFSDLDDLALFAAAQYDSSADALLTDSAREFLHRAVIEVDPAQARSMAAGWFVTSFPGVGEILGHGGEVDGHSSCVAILPGARAGLIVLANTGGDAAEKLCVALMQGVLPQLLAGR